MTFYKKKSNWFFNLSVDILFLNEYAHFKNKTKLKNKTKIKTKLEKTSVKILLNDIFRKKSDWLFNFCVGTLLLNEHAQLKIWFKLKKILV